VHTNNSGLYDHNTDLSRNKTQKLNFKSIDLESHEDTNSQFKRQWIEHGDSNNKNNSYRGPEDPEDHEDHEVDETIENHKSEINLSNSFDINNS